jgi:hypothetical protein
VRSPGRRMLSTNGSPNRPCDPYPTPFPAARSHGEAHAMFPLERTHGNDDGAVTASCGPSSHTIRTCQRSFRARAPGAHLLRQQVHLSRIVASCRARSCGRDRERFLSRTPLSYSSNLTDDERYVRRAPRGALGKRLEHDRRPTLRKSPSSTSSLTHAHISAGHVGTDLRLQRDPARDGEVQHRSRGLPGECPATTSAISSRCALPRFGEVVAARLARVHAHAMCGAGVHPTRATWLGLLVPVREDVLVPPRRRELPERSEGSTAPRLQACWAAPRVSEEARVSQPDLRSNDPADQSRPRPLEYTVSASVGALGWNYVMLPPRIDCAEATVADRYSPRRLPASLGRTRWRRWSTWGARLAAVIWG